MKKLACALLIAMVPLNAHAIQRYTSTSMSCERVQATIRADGAAIMRYQSRRMPNLPLFGRYVRDDGFCDSGEYAELVYIPAADTPSCPVRECRRIEYEDGFMFLPGR